MRIIESMRTLFKPKPPPAQRFQPQIETILNEFRETIRRLEEYDEELLRLADLHVIGQRDAAINVHAIGSEVTRVRDVINKLKILIGEV